MNKIVEYKLLNSTSAKDLVLLVNEHIEGTWQPLGAMQCFTIHKRVSGTEEPIIETVFAQTVVKYEE